MWGINQNAQSYTIQVLFSTSTGMMDCRIHTNTSLAERVTRSRQGTVCSNIFRKGLFIKFSLCLGLENVYIRINFNLFFSFSTSNVDGLLDTIFISHRTRNAIKRYREMVNSGLISTRIGILKCRAVLIQL